MGQRGALRFRMHSTSDWNLHKFKDAEVDAKIEAAEAAATMEEQLRLASELDMKADRAALVCLGSESRQVHGGPAVGQGV